MNESVDNLSCVNTRLYSHFFNSSNFSHDYSQRYSKICLPPLYISDHFNFFLPPTPPRQGVGRGYRNALHLCVCPSVCCNFLVWATTLTLTLCTEASAESTVKGFYLLLYTLALTLSPLEISSFELSRCMEMLYKRIQTGQFRSV